MPPHQEPVIKSKLFSHGMSSYVDRHARTRAELTAEYRATPVLWDGFYLKLTH
jgi:hypothetical protein